MPEIIHCPQCERQLRVPEELLGKQVQCPSCSATFTAAGRGGETPPLAVLPAEEPAVLDDPAPRRRNRRDDYEYDDYDRPRRGRRDGYGDYAPHRGSTILTLGIVSFFCFGIILGPVAWVMGHNDMAAIRAGHMDPEGEGLTNAGRILGIISTILHGAVILIYVLIIVAAVAGNRF